MRRRRSPAPARAPVGLRGRTKKNSPRAFGAREAISQRELGYGVVVGAVESPVPGAAVESAGGVVVSAGGGAIAVSLAVLVSVASVSVVVALWPHAATLSRL